MDVLQKRLSAATQVASTGVTFIAAGLSSLTLYNHFFLSLPLAREIPQYVQTMQYVEIFRLAYETHDQNTLAVGFAGVQC